jgi:hypothetical protein
MTAHISSESLAKAYRESDKYFTIDAAKQEFNKVHNDGMTIKIPQDNLYDWMVNTFDHRRVLLEKKAEILNDYYGDRLLAKDLFKDYISYKRKTTGVANLLSLGLVGANMYTRVMKNSVFLGKFGTLAGILALQATGRCYSNTWLEKKLETPWKIHNYRMSKGLGPTNYTNNDHSELVIIPVVYNVHINFYI